MLHSSSSSPNLIQQCQRCHSTEPTIYCSNCEPFHLFCHHCDSVIHSVSIKSNHQRTTLSQTNTPIYQQPLNSITLTQGVHTNINSIYKDDLFSYSYTNPISNNNADSLSYTKEYMNEINQLHNKEKNELQYKINSLQSNLDRIKLSFHSQLQKMQNEINLSNAKAKTEYETMMQKHNEIIKEKNSQISSLNIDKEQLQNEIQQLQNQIQQCQLKELELQNQYNLQIQNLNSEIEKAFTLNNNLRLNNEEQNKILIQNHNSQIEKLNIEHQKQMETITCENKFKVNKLEKQLNEYLTQINMLKDENNLLKLDLCTLDNKNNNNLNELNQLRNSYNELNINFENEKQNNLMLMKNCNKAQKDNLNLRKDFDFLEKTIESLKKEVMILKDSCYKKETEYKILFEQSEKMRKDFSEKMFNVSILLNIF